MAPNRNFGNRNFMQPIGRLSMHSKCLGFFFSFKFCVRGGGARRIFKKFSFVLNMFSMGSHQVLNICSQGCSPRVFPIAPRFYAIFFAQSPTLVIHIITPKDEITTRLCWDRPNLDYFLLLMGQSQNKKNPMCVLKWCPGYWAGEG